MLKKISTIIIIIFTILWGAYHCKDSDSSIGENELVFWTLQMGDFSDYMQNVIKEYETQNPNVKIKWIDVPFSEGEKRTLAAVLSNTPPDLINLNPDFSALLAEKGALAEISDEKLTQFPRNIIKSLKFNEKNYTIPWYATSAITIYNKKLLEQAGYSNPPETFKRLGSIAEDIKAQTGAFVLMPTITENDTMLKILNKYGASSAETINSAKSIEVFEYYKNLYDKNLIPKESVTQTQREALEKYMSGQLVFFESGANFLNMIKENAPSIYEDTDVSTQFTGSLGQYNFSLMNLIIPLKSKKKDAALDFALFLTNKKNQLDLAKRTNIIAVNKLALKDDFYSTYTEADKISKARCISAKQLEKIDPTLKQTKGQKEINLLINTAVQKVLINNDSPEKVLDEVALKWKNIIKK